MVTNLMQLFLLTGEEGYRDRADAIVDAFLTDIVTAPHGHTGLLAGSMDAIAPQQIAVVGQDRADDLVDVLRETSLPGAVVQHLPSTDGIPAASPLHGKSAATDGSARAYVCSGPVCSLPIASPEVLRTHLHQRAAALTRTE